MRSHTRSCTAGTIVRPARKMIQATTAITRRERWRISIRIIRNTAPPARLIHDDRLIVRIRPTKPIAVERSRSFPRPPNKEHKSPGHDSTKDGGSVHSTEDANFHWLNGAE